MDVSYKPLKITLVKLDSNITELCRNLNISTSIRAKLNNDTGYVALETIAKICVYLDVPIEEVVEILR